MGLVDEDTVLVGVMVLYRDKSKNKREWLIAKKEEDGDWVLPRQPSRKKSESTAKAAIRLSSENFGVSAKVLEEAGRAGGVTSVNGETRSLRTFYYLMRTKSSDDGEVKGYADRKWLSYASAVRKLASKRDRKMIKSAREELRDWIKRKEEEEKENKKK